MSMLKKGIMRILTSILVATFMSFSAQANEMCVKVVSQGEGHWPIPEEAFTKIKAREASRELESLLKNTKHDFLSSKDSGGLDIGCYVLNRVVYIKGYALRSEALESAITDKKNISKWTINNFCKFLEKEAYVCH